MFIEKIKTPGIAHLSYVFGSDGKACVIDPRRDCHVYIEIAAQHDCRITHILETHRNEDLLTGSSVLAKQTGAQVLHGPHADGEVEYAETTTDGDELTVGSLLVRVLETPGHTKDSVCYLLIDTNFGNGPVGIFTGDTLFIGDVGRADFYPDQREEMAGALWDSLQKIRSAAETAQLYPAHGAGSVCGDDMAAREFSTVAHEFANNKALALDRDEFVGEKSEEFHYKPPYFALMERLNLSGAKMAPYPRYPRAVTMSEYREQYAGKVKAVDVRSVEAYLGAALPNTLCLPDDMISAYGGWLLKPDDRILVLAQDAQHARDATLFFNRIGYDNIVGYLPLDVPDVASKGEDFVSLDAIDTETVDIRLEEAADDWYLVDVRKKNEFEEQSIAGSLNHFLGELRDTVDALDKTGHVTVMCGSGKRATVAASLLRQLGFERVDVYLGSIGAWMHEDKPVV